MEAVLGEGQRRVGPRRGVVDRGDVEGDGVDVGLRRGGGVALVVGGDGEGDRGGGVERGRVGDVGAGDEGVDVGQRAGEGQGAVAVPPTVTVPLPVAASVPPGTDSVTVMLPRAGVDIGDGDAGECRGHVLIDDDRDRDGQHRRVVDRGDIEGDGLGIGWGHRSRGIAAVVDADGQRLGGGVVGRGGVGDTGADNEAVNVRDRSRQRDGAGSRSDNGDAAAGRRGERAGGYREGDQHVAAERIDVGDRDAGEGARHVLGDRDQDGHRVRRGRVVHRGDVDGRVGRGVQAPPPRCCRCR